MMAICLFCKTCTIICVKQNRLFALLLRRDAACIGYRPQLSSHLGTKFQIKVDKWKLRRKKEEMQQIHSLAFLNYLQTLLMTRGQIYTFIENAIMLQSQTTGDSPTPLMSHCLIYKTSLIKWICGSISNTTVNYTIDTPKLYSCCFLHRLL